MINYHHKKRLEIAVFHHRDLTKGVCKGKENSDLLNYSASYPKTNGAGKE